MIKLHRRLGITTMYVTHDQVEAMTMGDRIVVMNAGQVQQCDTPLNLYHSPANKFVAGFIGSPAMNFVPVEVRREGDALNVTGDGFQLALPPDLASKLNGASERSLEFGVRPEDMRVLTQGEPAPAGSIFRALVDVVEPMGATSLLYLTAGKTQLIASVEAETAPREGDTADVVVDMPRTHLFDASEQALF